MKEENNGASKRKWSRIFRKKWFFPAVYLLVAAMLLTVVVWYQNLDNQIPDVAEQQDMSEGFNPDLYGEEVESVLDQQEVIKMPIAEQEKAEIVTKFYDYDAEEEDQENGLVLYNNRYYQSKGIDIASAEGETFEVTASLSGEVTEVKEDPLLGNVVIISHENDVMTYYASLGEVDVATGSKVKQGDTIGTAGKNLFGKDNGTHIHFQIRKAGLEVNPESFLNQPLSKLDQVKEDKEETVESDEEDPAKHEDEDSIIDTDKDKEDKEEPDKPEKDNKNE